MPNNIKALRAIRGLTLEQLAELAGTSYQQVQRLESGERRLTVDWMTRLAPALGVDPRDLIGDLPNKKDLPSPATAFVPTTAGPLAGADRTLPILGRAKGGADGVILISQDERPIDWTHRPPLLRDVADAFGFFVTGESMKPAYDEGDIGWVHPHMPPRRDKPVLVVKVNDEAILKVFERQTPDALFLAQHNPASHDIVIPAAEVRQLYRVVGKWEAQ